MSWTKNNLIRCDSCGLFCAWGKYDEHTPFGVSAYTDYGPEPHDPVHECEKCAKKEYNKKLEYFRNGGRNGDWQKSLAENKAAKECGLEWVDSNGYIDTRTNLDIHYCYILKSEKHFYIPYLEFLKDPENRAKHEAAKQEKWAKLPSLI